MTHIPRIRKGTALLLAVALVLLVLPVSSAPADSGVTFVRVLLSTESASSMSIPVESSTQIGRAHV